jgi:hypothetical protein
MSERASDFQVFSPHRLTDVLTSFLMVNKGGAPMADEDCPFKVVRTNGSDEVLARSVNLIIGLGSYVVRGAKVAAIRLMRSGG